MRFVRTLAPILALSVSACGTFTLYKGGSIPAGKTKEQTQIDVLTCKDKARTESQTSGDQARGFILGATLSFVGVAIDYDQQKKDQRRIFKDCMDAMGYNVTPGDD